MHAWCSGANHVNTKHVKHTCVRERNLYTTLFLFLCFCDVVLVICVTKIWKVATQSHWACKTMKGHDKTKVQPPTASQHACKQERNIGGQQGWVEERKIYNNKRNTTTWQPCRHGMHKNLTQCTMPNQRKNNQADTTEKTDAPRQWRGSKAQCMLTKDKATQTQKSMGKGTENIQKYHKGLASQQTACNTESKQKGESGNRPDITDRHQESKVATQSP